jgi:hypothetical protein
MNVSVDNVALDCQGHTIDGKSVSGQAVSFNSHTNLSVRNCYMSDYTDGIYFINVSYSLIDNVTTAHNIDDGIDVFEYSSYVNLTNIRSFANGVHQIYVGNRDGVVLDPGHRLENITVTGVNTSDFGIYLEYVTDFYMNNIFINESNVGLSLNALENGVMEDIVVESGSTTGLFLNGVLSSQINGVIISDSVDCSISIIGSNYNNITNATISDSVKGLCITNSINNIVSDSVIFDSSGYGIYFVEYTETGFTLYNNSFYNNLFNNSVNFYCYDEFTELECSESGVNFWNITQQLGTRIYSLGTQIGGNYWTNLSADGYSDVCIDTNENGFCDDVYNVINNTAGCTSNNCDYIPYSDEGIADTCTPPASGNYAVNAVDNCHWVDNDEIPGNVSITGTGNLTLSANWTFTGANQYINIGSGCSLVITSGGSIQ